MKRNVPCDIQYSYNNLQRKCRALYSSLNHWCTRTCRWTAIQPVQKGRTRTYLDPVIGAHACLVRISTTWHHLAASPCTNAGARLASVPKGLVRKIHAQVTAQLIIQEWRDSVEVCLKKVIKFYTKIIHLFYNNDKTFIYRWKSERKLEVAV